ncbi:MAG TPA: hypothetical protein VGQ83_26725 [Polyangia bacterium]|jgi:hypothetical protein
MSDYVDHDQRKANEFRAAAARARDTFLRMRAKRPLTTTEAAVFGLKAALARGDVVEVRPHHLLPSRLMNGSKGRSYAQNAGLADAFEPFDDAARELLAVGFANEYGEAAATEAEARAEFHEKSYRAWVETAKKHCWPIRRSDPDAAERLRAQSAASVNAQRARLVAEERAAAAEARERAAIRAQLLEAAVDAEIARRRVAGA